MNKWLAAVVCVLTLVASAKAQVLSQSALSGRYTPGTRGAWSFSLTGTTDGVPIQWYSGFQAGAHGESIEFDSPVSEAGTTDPVGIARLFTLSVIQDVLKNRDVETGDPLDPLVDGGVVVHDIQISLDWLAQEALEGEEAIGRVVADEGEYQMRKTLIPDLAAVDAAGNTVDLEQQIDAMLTEGKSIEEINSLLAIGGLRLIAPPAGGEEFGIEKEIEGEVQIPGFFKGTVRVKVTWTGPRNKMGEAQKKLNENLLKELEAILKQLKKAIEDFKKQFNSIQSDPGLWLIEEAVTNQHDWSRRWLVQEALHLSAN